MRILIADDHEAVRKGISTILTANFDLRPEDCVEATNGQDAIEKAVLHKPDVVVLDINMPMLNGFAAAKELQRLMPDTPILFFTMHSGEQFVLEARKAGVQGFVAKDRAGETLVDAVKALLRNETYF
jgi:DNA-binding NarL/FixJ family response regulator